MEKIKNIDTMINKPKIIVTGMNFLQFDLSQPTCFVVAKVFWFFKLHKIEKYINIFG
jgi:hypothetical protein